MGLRQRDQMADRPRDHVAVAVQISVALLPAPSTRAISRATEGFSASTAMVPDSVLPFTYLSLADYANLGIPTVDFGLHHPRCRSLT